MLLLLTTTLDIFHEATRKEGKPGPELSPLAINPTCQLKSFENDQSHTTDRG